MSTATEPKPFDPIAHTAEANKRDAAIRNGEALPEPRKDVSAPADKEPQKDTSAPESDRRPSRSERRQINQLLREIGELRGKMSVYEQMSANGAGPGKTVDTDPEPKRADFATDAEYNRAVGRWDTRQELNKTLSKENVNTEAADRIKEFGLKAEQDKNEIEWPEPWDEVVARAQDDGPEVEWGSKDNIFMTMRLFDSPHRAAMMYHLARFPEQFEELLALKGDEMGQDRFISRLEGRAEVLYSKRKAAQAEPEAKAKAEDRKHPADSGSPDGRTPPERREAPKPRPSTEVAPPRGGSPPPERPKPGDPGWLAYRNAQTGGR